MPISSSNARLTKSLERTPKRRRYRPPKQTQLTILKGETSQQATVEEVTDVEAASGQAEMMGGGAVQESSSREQAESEPTQGEGDILKPAEIEASGVDSDVHQLVEPMGLQLDKSKEAVIVSEDEHEKGADRSEDRSDIESEEDSTEIIREGDIYELKSMSTTPSGDNNHKISVNNEKEALRILAEKWQCISFWMFIFGLLVGGLVVGLTVGLALNTELQEARKSIGVCILELRGCQRTLFQYYDVYGGLNKDIACKNYVSTNCDVTNNNHTISCYDVDIYTASDIECRRSDNDTIRCGSDFIMRTNCHA
ncbi:uncharacterized protein LOC144362802 [Saccoglossus kowalevskii]